MRDQVPHDLYWNIDEWIGEVQVQVQVQPVGACPLRLLAHLTGAPYQLRSQDALLALKQPEGFRTSVNAKPYILARDSPRDAMAYPTLEPTAAVTRAIRSTWQDAQAVCLGHAQARYYHEARLLTIQDTGLEALYHQGQGVFDPNTAALWRGFERFLLARFPSARVIATVLNESPYPPYQYQEFLQTLGYWQLSVQAFGKELRQP